jgi:hypothetical protein
VAELDDANALMSHFDGMDPDFHRDPRFGIMEAISVVMQHDMAGMNKEVNVTGRPNSFSDLEIEFVIKSRDNPPMSLEALLETISCLPVHSFFVMVWDPGGIGAMYRLEGKPIFKKGGMLGNVSTKPMSKKPMPTHVANGKTTKEKRGLKNGHRLFQRTQTSFLQIPEAISSTVLLLPLRNDLLPADLIMNI